MHINDRFSFGKQQNVLPQMTTSDIFITESECHMGRYSNRWGERRWKTSLSSSVRCIQWSVLLPTYISSGPYCWYVLLFADTLNVMWAAEKRSSPYSVQTNLINYVIYVIDVMFCLLLTYNMEKMYISNPMNVHTKITLQNIEVY